MVVAQTTVPLERQKVPINLQGAASLEAAIVVHLWEVMLKPVYLQMGQECPLVYT